MQKGSWKNIHPFSCNNFLNKKGVALPRPFVWSGMLDKIVKNILDHSTHVITTRILGYQDTEILEYWDTGILGYWNTGRLEYWDTGILEYWDTGILGYWNTRTIFEKTKNKTKNTKKHQSIFKNVFFYYFFVVFCCFFEKTIKNVFLFFCLGRQ